MLITVYQVRKRFSDGRGAARVDKDGDLNVSFPKPPGQTSTSQALFGTIKQEDEEEDEFADAVDGEGPHEDRHEAWRFLLAGGVAGAGKLSRPCVSGQTADSTVSRTVTAPFDRLKVYLITTTNAPINSEAINASTLPKPIKSSWRAVSNLWGAVRCIYADGAGLKAFWVGNGLNVTKIFPVSQSAETTADSKESAIKFVSYEQSKRFLAKYWDGVSDQADLSSSSRFIAGGVGGITSQFAIYGLETLKTRIQSEIGPAQGWRAVAATAKTMWRSGGIRAYYRGLTVSTNR